MKYLLKNGTVVTGEKSEQLDILVEGEKIVQVGKNLPSKDAQEIDVSGKLLFPGFIDGHTHFDLEVAGTVTADDFETGTKAAILGGTTFVIDYASQDKGGHTLKEGLDKWHKKADDKCSCDYSFHMSIVEWNEKTEQEFKAFLSSIGDSIVCVALDDIVKVHVHTNHPGQAFEKALEYGQLTKMKVDNMREEHNQKVVEQAEVQAAVASEAQKKNGKPIASNQPKKDFGFVTIVAGEGLAEIFKGLGVDSVIEGGQTMNPSTDDMLSAIDEVNADHIFILPNNKNIILAANQAQSLTDDKDIIVIPTKTVPQGITAIISYMPEADVDTNIEALEEAIKNVKTGQVTYAVRDTHIDDKEIHEGDIMGIGDRGILAVGQSVEETTKEMLAQLVDEESELISLYFGQDVLEEDAENFAQEVEELYPDVDVDVHMGGQPIYYYVLSVE